VTPMKSIIVLCLFLVSVFSYNVDQSKISVSGLSAGGFMAVQYHVSYSQNIMGIGVIAGGPYWCAMDNLGTALSSCMTTPDLISVEELVSATSFAYNSDSIDNTKSIANAKLYLFSGTQDTVVNTGVVKKTATYYTNYMPSSQITQVYTIPAEHSFPTTNTSFPDCDHLGTPYINNCGYDAAGEVLQTIYGTLQSPVPQNFSNIIELNQANFVPSGWTIAKASLYSTAYAYIPTACANNNTSCSLHVAFHGCEQTIANIGDLFYLYTGYNDWAESNNIIILYPQAAMSDSVPYNPKGCFDWWGYTESSYATQLAPQPKTVEAMIAYLSA